MKLYELLAFGRTRVHAPPAPSWNANHIGSDVGSQNCHAIAPPPPPPLDVTVSETAVVTLPSPVAVPVIVPLYVVFKNLALFDTHLGLILLYTTVNLPLVIWMMRSFFADLPYETIEAARIDGATLLQEFGYVILPLALPGLMATLLLCVIFTWNEFFIAFNLTITQASPLSVFIVSFKTSEGLFWAKMSAAATLTALPVVIAGWVAQRQLVRGLTAGAVK